MADTPTFVFDDDGKAYAYLNGKVVAAADDADALEQKLAFGGGGYGTPGHDADFGNNGPFDGPGYPDDHIIHDRHPEFNDPNAFCEFCGGQGQDPNDPTQPCMNCGGTGKATGPDAQQVPQEDSAIGGADLPAASPDTLPGDNLPPRATHVTTPNGLKGQILGKTKSLWGEQVTIRLENGRIAKFDVTDGVVFTNEKTASAPSPVAAIKERLASVPDGSKTGLLARVDELKRIKREAGLLVPKASWSDQQSLNEIVLHADYELREVSDALAALEDAEPYAPPAPFDPQVVEQESVGGGDSSWLDDTINQMVAETEDTDWSQELNESPELLAAEAETPALADADTFQTHALSYIRSKTAGLDPATFDKFEAAFLARAEDARRIELATRTENIPTQEKEASTEDNGTDEGLFW